MKILFFIESLLSGGKERRLVELIKGMEKNTKNQLVLVLTKRDIHYKEVLDLNIEINIIERRFTKKDPLLFIQFYRIAKEFSPDIIHVWGVMVALYALPTKLILNIPLINNQITDAPPKVRNFRVYHRLAFLFSDLIIANSNAGLITYKAPRHKGICIYNGFDFNRINSLESEIAVRKKFNIGTEFVIGMVSSFSVLKDYKTYILAALNILQDRTDVTFLCIGSGDDTEIRKLVPMHNRNNILFLGVQNSVESIMNICNVGILMSNSAKHGEGISNSLMEFMALGKPVIASNGGGTKELIVDGKSGFIVEAGNIVVLTKKVKLLLNNERLRQQIGKNGRNRIVQSFGIDKMLYSFNKIFEKICAE